MEVAGEQEEAGEKPFRETFKKKRIGSIIRSRRMNHSLDFSFIPSVFHSLCFSLPLFFISLVSLIRLTWNILWPPLVCVIRSHYVCFREFSQINANMILLIVVTQSHKHPPTKLAQKFQTFSQVIVRTL